MDYNLIFFADTFVVVIRDILLPQWAPIRCGMENYNYYIELCLNIVFAWHMIEMDYS